jgi:hypothetical protein
MIENDSSVATQAEFINPLHNQRPGAPEHLSVQHSVGPTDDETFLQIRRLAERVARIDTGPTDDERNTYETISRLAQRVGVNTGPTPI